MSRENRPLAGLVRFATETQVRGTRSASFALLVSGLALSCNQPHAEIPSPPFEEVFELAEVVELGEHPADSVAEIGVFQELRNGGFAIADDLQPRVRTYSSDGSLLAAFGRFGSGPWEFREIDGLVEMPSGQIVVASPRNQWLTYLKGDLSPDTMLPIDYIASDLLALGQSIVFSGYGPLTGETLSVTEVAGQSGFFHRLVDGQVMWSRWKPPAFDKPYWGSLADMPAAVAGDSIFLMVSMLYPATILNGAGDSVGTIGVPSPSFRRSPELPMGYFATEQAGPKMVRWLASFDDVPRIDVVGDDYLVFTIGHNDETKPNPPFRILHTRVEAYDRHSGAKLFEDVELPQGAKVLGGGRYLYVLLNPDFPPWRIAKYRLVAGR